MDAKLIAKGIVDGLASIPNGLYLSAVRTVEGTGIVDRDLKARNEIENERFFRVLKSLAANEAPIRQLVTIVITDFYTKLDDKGKKRLMKSWVIQMLSWEVGLVPKHSSLSM